jgi:hypothetical protein
MPVAASFLFSDYISVNRTFTGAFAASSRLNARCCPELLTARFGVHAAHKAA